MSDIGISQILAAIVSDGLTKYNFSGPTSITGLIADKTIGAYLQKLQDQAFEILLSELRDGKSPIIAEADVPKILSMTLRYGRAALEGTAKVNLRMMAKAFSSICREPIIYPDKFQGFAGKLADLTSEEVRTIALVYRYKEKIKERNPEGFTECDEIGRSIFGAAFDNPDVLLAHCASASRTGFIRQQHDGNLFEYTTTPILEDLFTLAEFRDALDKESD